MISFGGEAIQRFDGIQTLRGVAALLVAAFHLNASAVHHGTYDGAFSFFLKGEAGVDIFFVISGFIIFYTSSQKAAPSKGGTSKPRQGWRSFVTARFWRIFPPYWFVLGVYIALALALYLVLGDATRLPSLWTVVNSFFLFPYPDYVIVIAWTLAIELLFYAIFCLSFFRFGATGFFIAMVAWVACSQLYKIQNFYKAEWLGIILHSAVLEFLFGAMIASFVMRRPDLPGWRVSLVGAVCYFLFYLPGALDEVIPKYGREFSPGIPAAFLVYGMLGWVDRVPKTFIQVGESSYLLYLVHLLVFSVFSRIINAVWGVQPFGSTLWMLLMLIAALGVATLMNIYLEQPYQRWYRLRQNNL